MKNSVHPGYLRSLTSVLLRSYDNINFWQYKKILVLAKIQTSEPGDICSKCSTMKTVNGIIV